MHLFFLEQSYILCSTLKDSLEEFYLFFNTWMDLVKLVKT